MKAELESSMTKLARLVVAAGIAGAVGLGSVVLGAAPHVASGSDVANPPSIDPGAQLHLDRSGRKQVGKASFYADRYSGQKMADGTPMHLYSNNAASLTLPLGTTAMVTNLANGKSALVTIRDRGPYVKDRIVDLSPMTARAIGISRRQGLAIVQLIPISVPTADGTLRVSSLGKHGVT